MDEFEVKKKEIAGYSAFIRSGIKKISEIEKKFENYPVKFILTKIGSNKSVRILEVGAGNCQLSSKISILGHSIVAIDFNTDEEAGLRAVDNADFERVCGDCERMPFRDSTFDIVFCRSTLHHAWDLNAMVKEMVRLTNIISQYNTS